MLVGLAVVLYIIGLVYDSKSPEKESTLSEKLLPLELVLICDDAASRGFCC